MRRPRDGSALILALWSLFFLSAISIAVATQVSADLALARQLRNGLVARSLAVAGAETAIADLASGVPALTNDPGRFRESAVLDAGVFTVSCVTWQDGRAVTNYGLGPESAKLNLNRAGTAELAALLRERGLLAEDAAASVANCIVDWRDADSIPLTGGAEDDYYSSLRIAYSSHDGDLTCVEELLLVKGVTPELFSRVRPYVTVASGDCFGATAEGFAIAGGLTTAVARVEFVVDRAARKIFWYEQ